MKKKLRALLLSLSLVVSGLCSSLVSVQAAPTTFAGTHFGEGFDSYNTDTMHKAENYSNGEFFNCTWRGENVVFTKDSTGNGIMELKIDNDSDGQGYSGGEYRTNQAFGYGMYTVRMKPIKNPGVVTSFFTYTGPSDGTIWDEIDIEFLGYDTTKVQFNYYTNGVGGHEKLYDLGFDASQEFHDYGFYWAKDYIAWYVDGKEIYRATANDIPKTPSRIMMNAWPGTGVDDWLQPYNGATPLTGYYDWFSYDAPSTGTTETVEFDSNTLYKFTSKVSGKVLDVAYGALDNGTNVLQYTYYGNPNQKWYIRRQSNGYYTIENYATGKVLSVQDQSTENGANIHQWEYVGNANQEWTIQSDGNGYYKLINRNSGKLVDVTDSSTADNTNIQQWEETSGSQAYLWSIEALN